RMMLTRRTGDLRGEVDAASTLTGSVVVGPGARVIRSTVRGPVVVGAETVLEDSVIGPNVSIERECSILRSAIEDSILMQGCVIEDVEGIAGSILGRNVSVRHRAGSHRLIVGDQSRIDID